MFSHLKVIENTTRCLSSTMLMLLRIVVLLVRLFCYFFLVFFTDTETDTLCSESRFLPVYSPVKKSHEIDRHGR